MELHSGASALGGRLRFSDGSTLEQWLFSRRFRLSGVCVRLTGVFVAYGYFVEAEVGRGTPAPPRRRWGGCTRTAEVGLVLGPEFHLGIPLCCLLWAVAHALATDPRFSSGCFCADSGYRVFFLLTGVSAEAEVGLVLGPEFHLGIPLCCLLWVVAYALATDPRFSSGCFRADSGYRVFACG